MSGSAHVLGVGAATPLGFDARQTALGIRAQKLAPRPVSFKDKRGETMGTARTLGLRDEMLGVDRMLEAGARALSEAVRDAGLPHDQPVRVFLAFPESQRPLPKDDEPRLVATSFLPELDKRARQRIDGARSEVLRLGHAGFAAALERAIAALGSGGPIAVGGIDTYHHPDTMAWLDEELRVLGDSVHNGFIPSEGAAFVVIGAPKGDKRPIARVAHVAAGLDQTPPDEPRVAATMTELVGQATALMKSKPVPWIISDMNGERHRTKEWTFVTVRHHDVIVGGKTREDYLGQVAGDMGAASGAVAAAFATVALESGFAPANEALIALHSDWDERGVVVMESVT